MPRRCHGWPLRTLRYTQRTTARAAYNYVFQFENRISILRQPPPPEGDHWSGVGTESSASPIAFHSRSTRGGFEGRGMTKILSTIFNFLFTSS